MNFKFQQFSIIIGSLLSYKIMDAVYPRGVLLWEISFAFVVMVSFSIILLDARNPRLLSLKLRNNILLLTLIIISGLVMSPFNDYFYPKYILGDLAIFLLMANFVILSPSIYRDITIERIEFITISILIISLFAYFIAVKEFSFLQNQGGRFDGTSVLLYSGLSTVAVYSRRCNVFVTVILFTLSLYVVFKTGWRGELLLALVSFATAILIILKTSSFYRFIAFSLLSIISIFLVFDTSSYERLKNLADGSRFEKFFEKGGDISTMNRVKELEDVFYNIENYGGYINWILGFGHGSCFKINRSYPEANLKDGNMVHNIHIHFGLWLFRYGIFGAVLYMTLSLYIVFHYFSLLNSPQNFDCRDYLIVISVFLLLIKSLAYTPLNDPVNILFISLFITLKHSRKLIRSTSRLKHC